MTARTVPMVHATDPQVRAVQSYYPYVPPPVIPESSITNSAGIAGYSNTPASMVDVRTDKGIVSRKWNRWGMFTRYTFGHVLMQPFKMIATGAVQSSQFQQYQNMPAIVSGNNFLYRAMKGYPYNLGLSEMVPTSPFVPPGQQAYQMAPPPRYTRTIFTRRSFGTQPGIAAKPQVR